MKYNELNISSTKRPKRAGRGIASGKGKTAGRGTKGQGSRTGFSKRPGFAGGQNPLMQRMPKLPGFTSHKTKMTNIFTSQLEVFGGKTVDTQLLSDNGLIVNPYVSVKLLHRGKLTKKVTVKLQGASENAIAAIQSAGGTFDKVERVSRVATSDKTAK